MRPVSTLFILLLFSFSSSAKIRLYSRDFASKCVADSLARIDSMRVADSIRVADSTILSRYKTADIAYEDEKVKKQKEIEASKPVEIDSSERIIQDSVDVISVRTLIIDEDNPFAREIDSLQNIMDSICNGIHDHDPWFKKMKTYAVSEKKRYMIYLMKNNLKDTSQILTYCNQLYQMYSTRIDLLGAIRNSQTTNAKIFITSHSHNLKEQMAELSDYILKLSSEEPSIQRQ
ncbi:MAG: hypothetical protein GX556_16595 [Fibrobacter sp.]|nr:hypothetical protein [Fibrobacter sp.]